MKMQLLGHAYGSGWLQIGQKLEKKTMTSQIRDMATSWNLLEVAVFFFSILDTGPGFMSKSWNWKYPRLSLAQYL